jgi:hypothetical protein
VGARGYPVFRGTQTVRRGAVPAHRRADLKALAKRWSKVALVLFAVGVVTGTILTPDEESAHDEAAPPGTRRGQEH